LHYVRPDDTLFKVSLEYHVSVDALRRQNKIFDRDGTLLHARRYVVIPGAATSNSLCQTPEQWFKQACKRFQVQCKCQDFYETKYYVENGIAESKKEREDISSNTFVPVNPDDPICIEWNGRVLEIVVQKALFLYNEDVEWERKNPARPDQPPNSKKARWKKRIKKFIY